MRQLFLSLLGSAIFSSRSQGLSIAFDPPTVSPIPWIMNMSLPPKISGIVRSVTRLTIVDHGQRRSSIAASVCVSVCGLRKDWHFNPCGRLTTWPPLPLLDCHAQLSDVPCLEAAKPQAIDVGAVGFRGDFYSPGLKGECLCDLSMDCRFLLRGSDLPTARFLSGTISYLSATN